MQDKSTEAISGMHMPSGENMWAYPADDDLLEEDGYLEKEAIGLLDVPKEIPRDNSFEQSPHIREDLDQNLGIIERESPVSINPVNHVEDEESDMSEVIKKLILILDKKGYMEYSNMLKQAQDQLAETYRKQVLDFFNSVKKDFSSDLFNRVSEVFSRHKPMGDSTFNTRTFSQELTNILLKESQAGLSVDYIKKIADLVDLARQLNSKRLKKKTEPDRQDISEQITKEETLFRFPPSKEVELIQEGLALRGANIVVDGKWGPKTERAWQDYWRTKRSAPPMVRSAQEALSVLEKKEREKALPQPRKKDISERQTDLKIDILSEIKKAIELMTTRSLRFDTPFRPERRNVRRWLRRFFDSIDDAANSVYETLDRESWISLIKDNLQKMQMPVDDVRGKEVKMLSGKFYEQIYQALKDEAIKEKKDRKYSRS